jgi:hypothetical protein
MLKTPNMGNIVQPGWTWAADNGCFNADTYRGDAAWFDWLQRQGNRETCLFAVAPDVVGDHDATMARSLPWLPRIRALGIPAAFVAQDGATPETLPWGAFDVLFIGGSDGFKLGPAGDAVILAAVARGVPVHVGRVNSRVRFRRFAALGCASADGTFLAFGPDVNLPALLGWVREPVQSMLPPRGWEP